MATTLQNAGSILMQGTASRIPAGPSTLGVRSLREEYLKPSQRGDIPRNLKIIEERLGRNNYSSEAVASEERLEMPRFAYLFQGGELLPTAVFVCALELGEYETLNSRHMPFDGDVIALRDNLIAYYKPLVAKIRQLNAREIDDLPPRLVLNFSRAWTAWEASWLRNREVHAVEALQPLAKAILALEPLLLSHEKEKLLPWPRVQHQKGITLNCLEGFVSALADLAGCVLPSLQRELDHDPRLLLLMDHVLRLDSDSPMESCIAGLSTTPDVHFPDHQHSAISAPVAPGGKDRREVTLDAYAFKLMGLSSGDAEVAKKAAITSQAVAQGTAPGPITANEKAPGPRLTDLSRRAVGYASELLSAFEDVKDMLLSLKSTLEYIDPAIEKDEAFVAKLQRLEKVFKKAKRLFLEPDNLA